MKVKITGAGTMTGNVTIATIMLPARKYPLILYYRIISLIFPEIPHCASSTGHPFRYDP